MFDRIVLAMAAVVFSHVATPAAAQQPVVVELYTSQGCSACPPADAFLGELAARPDVIALALHVDYWDYLGWRDVYARREFTRRQLDYRDMAGARSVYTPQMVIQGVERVVGSRREQVAAAMRRAAARPAVAEVTLKTVGDMKIEARITPRGPAPGPCLIWAVSYETPPPLKIASGENAGRVIQSTNVVRSWMRLGIWDGEDEVRFSAPIPEGAKGIAVILQDGKGGPIVAAGKIEF